jgi:hypothetical protein
MFYGYGRGLARGYGGGGGMGFAFRGSSPPWPYVGRGRGGLPRCAYYLGGGAGIPATGTYQWSPYTAGPGFGAGQSPYPFYTEAPQSTKEQEIGFLGSQAAAIKEQLRQMEARIQELEGESK